MTSPAEMAYRPIAATIVDRLRSDPHRVAIEWNGASLTSAQLLGWAGHIARRLTDEGLQPGDRLAVAGGRTPGFIAAMLAGLASGTVVIPLDPALPPARRRQMLDTSQATRVVEIGEQAATDLPTLTIDPLPAQAHVDPLVAIDRDARAPAYVYFTSGSTGRPKGILGSQIGLAHTVCWLRDRLDVGAGDRVAFLRSVSFDASLREALLPFVSNATMVIGPEPIDPDRAIEWLGEQRLTIFTISPSHVGVWLDAVTKPVPTRLRWSIFSGERLDRTIVERFRRATTSPGQIVNLYGPTESSFARTYGEVAEDPPEPIPVGYAMSDSAVHVLRPDGAFCDVDEPGEVVIATDVGTLGYLGDADQSPFIPDPGGHHAGAYRTGDRGWIQADGQLVVSGRFDDQVQILGVRLEPGEVSAALGLHPGVERAVVVPVPDPRAGHHFVAFVQVAAGHPFDEQAWREHLRGHVLTPGIPRRFVEVVRFPLNMNGKVDRAELRRRAERLDDDGDDGDARVAALSPVKRRLFEARLGTPAVADRTGPAPATPAISPPLGERVAALSVDQRTVLIDRLRRRMEASEPGERSAPASFAQERLWFLDKLFPGRSNYNIPRTHRVRGPLDVNALRDACDVVHARHEMLRTRFAEVDGAPVQVVAPVGPAPFRLVDATGADEERVSELVRNAGRQVFDLGTGPLWQVTVAALGPEDHLLSVVTHHIASDGWSMPPLYTELSEAYAAALRGEAPDLPPLPMQYADYSIRQRARDERGGFEADLDFWAAELDGAPPLMTIPGTKERPAQPSNVGRRMRFRVPEVSAELLRRIGSDNSVTPFMIGLALFHGYLSRITDREDLVIGVASADRETLDIQGLIGFLVNSLPMRATLDEQTSFVDLLGQIRDRAVRSYSHREVPFEHIVRRVSPPRSTSHTPIFQVFYQFGTGDFSAPIELGPGIETARIVRRSDAAKFDLALYLGTTEGALSGSMIFTTDLFDEPLMQEIIDGFAGFCAAALEHRDVPLRSLTPTAPAHRRTPMPVEDEEPSTWSADEAQPASPLAGQIAAVWSALFDRPVAVEDDFFALGGHSLMAIRMFSRLEAQHGWQLPIGAIFEHPTPAGLALIVEASSVRIEAAPPADRPEHVVREQSGPLSYAQQRLWFLDKLTPGTGNYHVPSRMRLRGPFDLGAFQSAVDAVVVRHGVFRTRIDDRDGDPIQVVRPDARVVVRLEDLSQLDEETGGTRLAELLGDEARRPFDLSSGPLLRAAVIRMADDDHVVSLVAHHIATDGESGPVLRADLRDAYAAALDGRPAALPPLPLEFVDVARRQIERFESGGDQGLDAWLDALVGAPPVLDLVPDLLRPQTQAAEAGTVGRRVDADTREQLLALAHQEGATPFMVALAAFGILLSRHTGERDLLIGTPLTERFGRETEELVGFFVNTVPIRIQLRPEMSFRDLLRDVRESVLFAMEHGDVPLEKIVRAVGVPRDPSRTPLFQVAFDLGRAGTRRAFHPSLESVPIGVRSRSRAAKFDLRLYCGLGRQRLGLSLEYRTDLFHRETMTALVDQYSSLLATIVARPGDPVDGLTMATDADARFQAEDGSIEAAVGDDLIGRFHEVASRDLDATAIVDGARSYTYGELQAASARVADRLSSAGIGPGHTVGLAVPRSARFVAAALGIVQSGAAYVPLDPTYPQARLDLIGDDAGLAAVVGARGGAGLEVEVGLVGSGSPALDPAAALAYVMYTSGSTGRPKGVMVPRRAIWRLAVEPDYVSLDTRSVVAFASNTAFDAATFEMWGALLNGARLHVLDAETVVTPDRLAAELRAGSVTTMFVTTALFNAVIAQRPDAFATLAELLFGGEAADVSAARSCLAAGPPGRLMNVYGPTETTTFATTYEITELAPATRTIPIGRPIGGTSVRILDAAGNDAPIGVPGELVIGGPGVTSGYLGDPDLTAAKFRPGADGTPEYHSGDQVRRGADGSIEFVGRLDRQLKMRGFRIEPGEIEAHLTSHPAVAEAAVLARQTDAGARLAAYVVTTGEPVTAAEALRHVSSRIPTFMVPSTIDFVVDLPRTPNGKLDVEALPAPSSRSDAAYVAPRGEAMQRMSDLWARVLEVDRVGAEDDFFALGGHSIVAIRLMAEITAEFGVSSDLAVLFEAPSLAALTERLIGPDQPPAAESPDVVVIRPGGPLPPIFCLPPAGGSVMVYEPMARAFDGERTFYGIRAPGTDGVSTPLRTIEEMAVHAEQVILETRSVGPYLLAGYSMGGLVAFEVARRLRSTGHDVRFVGLIDAQIPPRRTRRERLAIDARLIRRHGTTGLRLIGRRWRRSLRSAAGVVRHDPWAALARSRGDRLNPLQVGRQMTAAGRDASIDYEPDPYDGPVVYFRATGGGARAALRRWDTVTAGGLEVVDIAGMHKGPDSVMVDPHATDLAKEMRRILERREQQ